MPRKPKRTPKAPGPEPELPPLEVVGEDIRLDDDSLSKPLAAPLQDHEPDDDELRDKRASEVDSAYGVRPFYWKDKPLAPFAIDREGDWLRHRESLGEPEIEHLWKTPAKLLPDAIRVLWFLSHDPEEWLRIPAMKLDETIPERPRWVRVSEFDRALELERKIRAWGAENILGDEGQEAVLLFYHIFNSSRETRTTIRPSGDGAKEREREKNAPRPRSEATTSA